MNLMVIELLIFERSRFPAAEPLQSDSASCFTADAPGYWVPFRGTCPNTCALCAWPQGTDTTVCTLEALGFSKQVPNFSENTLMVPGVVGVLLAGLVGTVEAGVLALGVLPPLA